MKMSATSLTGSVAIPADIKRINRQKILQVLRSGKTMTAADIHEKTGISRITVMRALQDYCDRGIVKSLGLGNTTSLGGKKPELFVFADSRKLLCINLWPKNITLALCALVSEVYAVTQYSHGHNGGLEHAFEMLKGDVKGYLNDQGIALEDLYGVVLSVPGTIDYDTKLLRYNSHAPNWGVDVPLIDYLRPIFGDDPVYFVDNAGKAVGRAVLIERPEYLRSRLMTVFTTWGVSACMMEKGHVLSGRDSLIGEIGHMVIDNSSTFLCGCGKRGCLESLVSARHMRGMMAAQDASQGESRDDYSFQDLFASSASGDKAAQKVTCYLAHCFAVALHNHSLAYNQEAVVFQGDFAWADEQFDRQLKKELSEFRYYPGNDPFSIYYDRRDLSVLAARGGAEQLKKMYFYSLD